MRGDDGDRDFVTFMIRRPSSGRAIIWRAAHEITSAAPRLHPREPARDPAHQLVEVPLPPDGVHAVAHGRG